MSATSNIIEALRQWRTRRVMPTRLGSADLRKLRAEIRDRSIFSAKVHSARLLDEVDAVVQDILDGKITQSTGRLRMQEKLDEINADLADDFGMDPAQAAAVPDPEDVTDIRSRRRKDLILETNVRQARNRALMVAGAGDYRLREYPAWELIRLYDRETPRGFRRTKDGLVPEPAQAWDRRWTAAGEAIGWDGVADVSGRFVARKDSPIWGALGDGEGGYDDSLLQPYPPFAYSSGMGWREVSLEEARGLGIGDESDEAQSYEKATLTPGDAEINRAFEGLSPEMQAALRKELVA